jgi:hypothetical protein
MIMPDNNNSDRDCFVNCLLGCIFTWSGSSSYVNEPVLLYKFYKTLECHSASYKTSVLYNLFYFGRINFLKTKKSFDFLKKKCI